MGHVKREKSPKNLNLLLKIRIADLPFGNNPIFP
jgi:hypothetical protein